MDWDPIRPNSAADSAPVAHCRDEAESAAAFEAQLATRYRDGRPIRIDAPLAAFLSPSAASLASSRGRTLKRGGAGFVVLFAAVLGLGAADVLPVAAQGAIADAARIIGLSLPRPAPAPDHAPQTPVHAPSHGSSDEPTANSGEPRPSSRSNAVGSEPPPVTPTHPPSDPGVSDAGSSAGAGARGPSVNPGPGLPESPGNSADHSKGNGPPMVPGSPGNGPPESPGNSADHSKGNGPPSNPGNSSNKQEAGP